MSLCFCYLQVPSNFGDMNDPLKGNGNGRTLSPIEPMTASISADINAEQLSGNLDNLLVEQQENGSETPQLALVSGDSSVR